MRGTPTTASISQTTPSINQTSMISSLLMELCCPADAQVLRRAVVSTCGKLLANDVTPSHTTTMLRSARQQQCTLGGRYTEACPPRGTLGGRRASALLPFCQLHLPKQPSGRVDVPGPVSIRTTLKANKEEMETAQCLAGEPLTVHVPYLNSKLSGSVPF